MLSVGIDAHAGLYVLCILDSDGAVVKERSIRGGPKDVAAYLRNAGKPESMKVCYEASLGYGVLHDALRPVVHEVQVAHPAKVRAIFLAKTKNDRIDARKLARTLYMNQVPRVHVPAMEVREWRGLIEHRRRTVDKRTATKNALRSLLRASAVEDVPKRLWTRKGLAWLKAVEFASPLTTLRRDELLLELEHFEKAVKLVTRELDKIAASHAGVRLLKTIPGVGPRTAEAVVAYLDDVRRFSSGRQAASYFGLVPTLDESGKIKRSGHITRNGPSTVRKYLVEASWQAVRHSRSFKVFFERIKGGKKDRKGLALVATARRLVEIMTAMLRSGEEWRKEEPMKDAA